MGLHILLGLGIWDVRKFPGGFDASPVPQFRVAQEPWGGGGGCLERGVVARSGGPVGRTETLEALGEDWRREAARCGGGAVVTEKRG